MATLWHVGDVIEVICEFDDSPTHLTTLRRVSWSFHQAVENVWTLLLGRQNSVIDYEHVDSIVQRYEASHWGSKQDPIHIRQLRQIRTARAALTTLRRTVTSFAWPWRWTEQSMSEVDAVLVDVPQLQSAEFTGREFLLELTAQFGTAAQLEALVHRCPHLLSNTPNVDSRALYCTARSGNLGCALVLLQHGSDINAKEDVMGNTIAHVACEHGHHAYLEGLIDAGYDVDLNVHSCTYCLPAFSAVPFPSTLQFLIARGADVDAANSWSETPASRAAASGAVESLRILLAAGARVPPATLAWKHPACLDVLAVTGADLNMASWDGETVAHRAARAGQLESLRTLHKHGANMFAVSHQANMFAVSNESETPEQLAARGGFTECVKFLAELRIANSSEHESLGRCWPNATPFYRDPN
jgi:ankyrin repeat protein